MNERITKLPGIGPARQQYFEKLGITTTEQLLRLYPRRYEDIGNIVEISDLSIYRNQKVTVYAGVSSAAVQKRLNGGRTLTSVPVSDSSGAINLYFFNIHMQGSDKQHQRYTVQAADADKALAFHAIVKLPDSVRGILHLGFIRQALFHPEHIDLILVIFGSFFIGLHFLFLQFFIGEYRYPLPGQLLRGLI